MNAAGRRNANKKHARRQHGCWQSAGEAGHGCPMARGRNGVNKKPETSSSVSEGWVWEVPSQKEKRDLIVVIFCSDMTLWGSCPRCPSQKSPALNATGRLSSLQQKTFAPAPWGIHALLRRRFAGIPASGVRVFCLRFGVPVPGIDPQRSLGAHHKRRLHLQ